MSKRLLPLLLVLVAAGCAHITENQKPAAQQAMQAGNYQEAAQDYLQLAGKAKIKKKQHYLVLAALAAERAGENDLAQNTLAKVFPNKLSPNDLARAHIVHARLYLAKKNPAKALETLEQPEKHISTRLAGDALKLRAIALFQLSRPLPAVKALVQRGKNLSGQRAQDNNKLIWQGLQTARLPRKNAGDLVEASWAVRGWIALARIQRASWRSKAALEKALQHWRSQYPSHPAAQRIAPRIVAQYKQRNQYPGRIALLLPLSGHLKGPAEAVQNGFLAGRFMSKKQEGKLPDITVYNSGGGPQSALKAYQKAVDAGADVIIGPLTKKAVSAVAGKAKRSQPELALNYPPQGDHDKAPSDFYRLGLSPNDSAREAASRASQAGLKRALVLAPDNDWGRRVVRAFREALQNHGGTIVRNAYFRPGKGDYSIPIKQVLKLHPSKSQSENGNKKKHLVPRDDADFIFFASQPKTARLIVPELRFYHAEDLPIYAASSVYTGTPDPNANRDEDSMIFCDTPWTVSNSKRVTTARNKIKKLWPHAFSHYPRLFALGLDAYRLVPSVHARALAPGEHFQGYTGSLYNNGNGRILRDLPCARFRNGKVVPLD
jgi:outer membrane PBP1 activator LpoA protein